MQFDRLERKLRQTRMSHAADDAAVTAGGDVTAGPGVAFLDVARGENLFVEDRHRADAVASVLVRPYARCDVIDRVDNVAIAVVGDGAVWPLRRIAGDRHSRVDQ